MPTLPFRFHRWIESGLLGAAVFLTLLPFKTGSVFTIFQARDLERAAAAAKGSLFLWGPETTGGGNLPGGFYYWLLSIPYYFNTGWGGAWFLMAAMDALAAVLIWNFLRRIGLVAAAFGVLFYVSSALRLNMFKVFWNPSFLFVFLAMILIGYCRAFTEPKTARWAWPMACAALGLAMQIHLSVLPLAAAPLVLQFRAKQLGVTKLNRRDWWTGLGVLALTLSPYMLWKICAQFGIYIGTRPPETAGLLRDSLYGIIMNPASQVLLEGGWFTLARRLFVVTFQLVPWPAWIAFTLSVVFYFKHLSLPSANSTQKVLLVCLACTFSSAALYYYLPFGNRYALPFGITAALLLGTYGESWFSGERRWRGIPLGVAVAVGCIIGSPVGLIRALSKHELSVLTYVSSIAVLLGLCVWLRFTALKGSPSKWPVCLALFAIPFSIFQVSPGRVIVGQIPSARESRAAAIFIHDRTGWDYETARRKIHFFMIHRESDIEPVFTDVVERRTYFAESAVPDGFLMTLTNDIPTSAARVASVFARANGAEEINTRLSDGSIQIVDYIIVRRMLIASFKWANPQLKAEFETIHNIGYSHGPSPEDRYLDSLGVDGTAAKVLPDGNYLFQWNDCPGQPRFGKTAVIVEPKAKSLRVTIAGQVLSKPSPWTIPYCTQGWVDSYIELTCESGVKKFPIAHSIGLNWQEPPVAAQTFVAPFVRNISHSCSKIIQMKVGRESLAINDNGSLRHLPDKPLTLNLHPSSAN